MRVIEPHIHMISRTTADYEQMARNHTVACCEPAFWVGYDRTSPQAFHDYFHHITHFEPQRAAKYCIDHYCWICINPKEAEDVAFSREVMSFIPEFLDKPNVLGVGEIGLNKNTRNEMTIFEEQVEIALKHDQLILIHTPHLDDKLKGTRMMVEYLSGHGGVDPDRVLIDHTEEHTLQMVLDAGFWAGTTLYPISKNSSARMLDLLEVWGADRLLVNSAADWGPSNPGTLHDAVMTMRRHGYDDRALTQVFYDNPARFMAQCPKFKYAPTNDA